MTDPVSPTVHVEGLDRLVRTLKKAGQDITELKEAHRKVSDLIAREAEARAPRRSGKLAGSIRGTRQVRRARVQGGGARVPYAGPIHWGWPARHIGAQPFIADAATATESQWRPLYLEEIQRALDDVKGA